jgi:tetratricopeptide (TPR) repeat protein
MSGKSEEALLGFQKILEMDVSNMSALKGCCRIYRDKREWDKALTYVSKLLQFHSSDKTVMHDVGLTYLTSGKPDEAFPFWSQLVELEPTDQDYRNNYAMCLMDLSQVSEATQEFLTILQVSPLHDAANFNLGIIYMLSQNDLNTAKIHFENIKKSDKSEKQFIMFANAYLALLDKKWEEGKGIFHDILDCQPKLPHLIGLGIGYVFEMTNAMEKAIETYSRTIKNYPSYLAKYRLKTIETVSKLQTVRKNMCS